MYLILKENQSNKVLIKVRREVLKMSDKDIKTLITSGTVILAVALYLIFR